MRVLALLCDSCSTAGWEYIVAIDGTVSLMLAILNYPSSNSLNRGVHRDGKQIVIRKPAGPTAQGERR